MNQTQLNILRQIRAAEAQVAAMLGALEADPAQKKADGLQDTYLYLVGVAEALALAGKSVPR
jgi:hypothetical protein